MDQPQSDPLGSHAEAQRYRFLAEASALLAVSLDYRTTLHQIARLIVPALADWCSVDVLEGDHLQRLSAAHTDPSKQQLTNQMTSEFPAEHNERHGAHHVIKTLQPELYTTIPDELLREAALDEEHYQFFKTWAPVSAMVVPMVSRGKPLGAMTFVTAESGRTYSPEDLVVAEDLARRAAQAIDNALLHRQLQEEIARYQQVEKALQESERKLWTLNRDLETRVRQRTTDLTKSQEALVQAKKMEAIGRLAGGVAHDFNNLLTGITGVVEDVQQELAPGSSHAEDLGEVLKACRRASELTRQLLAFGRRQVAQPTPLNLNEVIMEMHKLFDRLLGEDIRITMGLDPRLGKISMDQTHLEQVIVNLVLNARDAMPSGGQLSLETSNMELGEEYARRHSEVQPGPYILLSVSDTGAGMDPDVLGHIFEPFYTTKEKGKGTGLGLATVYGIVKQSGGEITVQSAPGKGSIFQIYFPRLRDEKEEANVEAGREGAGNETILLVEDEEMVRRVAVRALERRGYRVLEARDGDEATQMARTWQGKLDLLVTDVVLPGVNGKELAHAMKELQPTIPILFMSGHSKETVIEPDLAEVAFLQKSFTSEDLCLKVREVLDAAAPKVSAGREPYTPIPEHQS